MPTDGGILLRFAPRSARNDVHDAPPPFDRGHVGRPPVSNHTQMRTRQFAVQESCEIRDQASDLLNQLLDHREQSEARFAEIGRTDPIKSITGRSAIDNAIETTRHLIRDIDGLIAAAPAPPTPATSELETTVRRINGQRITATQ